MRHIMRGQRERHHFFEELQHLADKVQAKGPFAIVGDFNARLHGRLMGEEDVIGSCVYGKRWRFTGEDTDNRQLLVDFCKSNDLRISNTWLTHPPGKQVTYKEPRTKHLPCNNHSWDPQDFAEIVFCLTPRRWRNSSTTVFSSRRANLDSDHFPLVACVPFKLGAKPKPAKYIRWDFRQASQTSLDDMNGAIEQQLNSSQRVVTNTTDKWEDLSKVYLVAISCHIPRYSVKPSRPWISESTLQLLARRGRFRTEGDMAQVAEFNREIRKAARRDKRAWLDEQLQTRGLECHHQSQKALPSVGPHLKPTVDGVPGTATSADIYAAHLAEKQWKEAGKPQTCPLHRC